MTNKILSDAELDVLFDAAVEPQPEISDALLSSIMASAAAQQASPRVIDEPKSVSVWSVLMDAVGGWPALGGLATATVLGVWIGISPPETLDTLTSGLSIDSSVSFDLWAGDLSDILSEG